MMGLNIVTILYYTEAKHLRIYVSSFVYLTNSDSYCLELTQEGIWLQAVTQKSMSPD